MNTNNKHDTANITNATAKPVAEVKADTSMTEVTKKNASRSKANQAEKIVPRFTSRRVWPD